MFGAVLGEISLDREWVGEELWSSSLGGVWATGIGRCLSSHCIQIKLMPCCLALFSSGESSLQSFPLETKHFFSLSPHILCKHVEFLLWSLYLGLEDYYDTHFVLVLEH